MDQSKLQHPSDEQSNRPTDCKGVSLSAFDIARLIHLPDYIYDDADTEELRETYRSFERCYGLVKYARSPDKDGWRRWYGPNGYILVEVTKIDDSRATTYEFVVPPKCVERLPFNVVIMNLFANFDWQIHWEAIGITHQEWTQSPPVQTKFPIECGTLIYERLKTIAYAPYEELVSAHESLLSKMPSFRESKL